MDLIEWQKKHRWQTQEMAKELGITKGMLSLIRRKHRKPSLLLAKSIERFTVGGVTLFDLGVEDKGNPVRPVGVEVYEKS